MKISFIAASISLVQVFAMRWNVVIGGQIFSKSGVGFRESYAPELGGREGAGAALLIMLLPFLIMGVFHHFLPLTSNAGDTESTSG